MTVILGSVPMPAHAVSKEIIQLQTQVQQLLDMVQRLQSTLDTRFGVLQNLAQQTADEANQMTTSVNALQKKMDAENEALSGKLDTTSGQMQSLNDSVDELKTRINKLDKEIQNLQSQLQNIQSPPPGSMPASGAAATPGTGEAGQAPGQMPPGQMAPGQTMAPAGPAMNQAPPLQATFQSALRDYNAAKYDLASSEFQDVIHYYPLDDLAGQSQFYLGEIAYRRGEYEDAIKAYNAVLEGFTGNAKAPAAQLHKGLALIKLRRRTAGIEELRQLNRRYPQTPEAAQARAKLNAMGVRISGR